MYVLPLVFFPLFSFSEKARLYTENWVVTVHCTPVHKGPQTGIKVHSNSELRYLQVLLKGQRRWRPGVVVHVSKLDIRKYPDKIKQHFGSRRNVTTASWVFCLNPCLQPLLYHNGHSSVIDIWNFWPKKLQLYK